MQDFSEGIELALQEDLKAQGDITSKSIFHPNDKTSFVIRARESMVFCGVDIIEYLLKKYSANYEVLCSDGDLLQQNNIIVSGEMNVIGLFSIERTLLNFIQHLSGIASITRSFVNRISHTQAKIFDTRKTTPGLRKLEKYAVQVGGGHNHRMGLYDMILIKDNHIAACGSIAKAIKLCKKNNHNNFQIEIECDNLEQVQEAISAKPDTIMLDNMNLNQIKEAVRIVNGKIPLEVSGGVNLENMQAIAELGVDRISVGLITHSAPNKDMGIDIESV